LVRPLAAHRSVTEQFFLFKIASALYFFLSRREFKEECQHPKRPPRRSQRGPLGGGHQSGGGGGGSVGMPACRGTTYTMLPWHWTACLCSHDTLLWTTARVRIQVTLTSALALTLTLFPTPNKKSWVPQLQSKASRTKHLAALCPGPLPPPLLPASHGAGPPVLYSGLT